MLETPGAEPGVLIHGGQVGNQPMSAIVAIMLSSSDHVADLVDVIASFLLLMRICDIKFLLFAQG
jgi:hypothetical protein